MRSRRSWAGRRVIVFVAALSGTLGAACSWSLGYLDDGQGDASPDTGGDGSLPDGFAADSGVPGVDASGSGEAGDGAADGGGNLMVNPSCADATFDWTTVSGTPLSSSSTFTYGGNHSCYASMRTNGYPETNYPDSAYDGPLQDITAVVSGGHEYSFSVWALWVPPGATPAPDAAAGDDGGAADADLDAWVADATARSDAADVSDGAIEAGTDAGSTNGPEEVYVTAKETCNGVVNYVPVVTTTGIPEATWTLVTTGAGGLMVPENCTDVQIYIGGPNIGMDLYTDEATLLFVQ